MNHIVSQLIALIPTLCTTYFAYRLSNKKSQRQKRQDELDTWKNLYFEMKIERDELMKQLNEKNDTTKK